MPAIMHKKYFSSSVVQYFPVFTIFINMNQKMQIDNKSLIQACIKGEKEALTLFYIRYAPLMLSVVRRYVHEEKDAEDILHDGFIVAFTRLKSLRDSNRVELWLSSIMKNLSLQFLHTQDVAKILHDLPEIEDTPEIEEIIDLDTLETLITKLPPGYQKVFRLSVLENKSHKEISKLLGIAPNSSSSQLFHAKMMMRKLIAEHKGLMGMAVLLLGALSAGLMIFNNRNKLSVASEMPTFAENRETAATNNLKACEDIVSAEEHIQSATRLPHLGAITASASPLSHSGAPAPSSINQNTTPAEEASTDSTSVNSTYPAGSELRSIAEPKECEAPDRDNDSIPETAQLPSAYYAYAESEHSEKSAGSGWSLSLGSRMMLNIQGEDYDNAASDNPQDPTNPETPPNPGENEKPETTLYNAPQKTADHPGFSEYKHLKAKHHFPVSFAISARKTLSNRIGIESGMSYTLLRSTFNSTNDEAHCTWHYVGIPLKFIVKTYSTKKISFYASTGAEINFPLSSNAQVRSVHLDKELPGGRFNSPIMFSLTASYGISLRLSNKVDLFIEPTVQYNFNRSHNVPNYWTESPFTVSIPFGLRFTH